MPNTLLTPTIITKEALRIFENELVLANKVDRQYDDRFAKEGAKIGTSLQIRRPVEYTVRSGATASAQDVLENNHTISVSTQRGIDFSFSSAELTLTVENFSDRYIKPAMVRLANEVDSIIAADMKNNIGNLVGTPGTTPATALVLLQAGQKLDENSTPRDNMRFAALNPAANAAVVNGLTGLFHSGDRIEEQYEKGVIGQGLGFKFHMSQNVPVHTVGPLGGTPLVNGALGASTWSETSSLVTDGWTASAANRLKAGDVITIAGVNAVNQQTKQSTGALRQFVVTADANSDGSGNLTAVIRPAIISSGPYQNVSAAAADNAAITVVGTAATAYPQNLAFHKSAFTLVTADLEVPRGVDMAHREVYKNISMRFLRDYNSTSDTFLSRFDILFGYKALRPEWACRITG